MDNAADTAGQAESAANTGHSSTAARPPHRCAANAAWNALHRAATAPYRGAGLFTWRFARGKLTRDPVFRALLERGDLAGRARIVDIGCGQGILASLLQACRTLQQGGAWPRTWPAAPAATTYTGIELMPRDVARAERALSGLPLAPAFVCADMCAAALPACDAVVILDVLHYVPHDAQAAVLGHVRDALQPQGRLLLRVGDAADAQGFAISQWVDRAVTWTRGHRAAPTWGRTLADWTALLQGMGFVVCSVPMSRGTPFANVLLVADLNDSDSDHNTVTDIATDTDTDTDTDTHHAARAAALRAVDSH